MRPSWDEYFMTIVRDVSTRSNCLRRKMGALLVRERAIISTGYNGTPMGVTNCFDGGCPRCASDVPAWEGYDWCLCVHAEANAILLAARHGSTTDGATMYTLVRPCIGCLKESIQAGIHEIVYEGDYQYEEDLERAYRLLAEESGIRLRRLGDSA